MTLPPGFISLAEAKKDIYQKQLVSIIGVVVDFRPPAQTRKNDFMSTIVLCDQTCAIQDTSFLVRLFGKPSELPDNVSLGNIVVFRNVKIGFNNGPCGMSNFSTTWVVCKTLIPTHKPHLPRPPTQLAIVSSSVKSDSTKPLIQEEENFVKTLDEFWKGRGGNAAASGLPTTEYEKQQENKPKHKVKQIQDIKENDFCILTVYVVKTYSDSQKELVTLYVTDYTKNEDLYDSGHVGRGNMDEELYNYAYTGGGVTRSEEKKKKTNQLFGQYCLQVTCWGMQARSARNIREGNFLLMNNVRIKKNLHGKLEGSLNDDKKYKSKVEFTVLNSTDSQLKPLHGRRRQMENKDNEKKKLEEEEKLRKKQEEENALIEEEKRLRAEVNSHIHCGYDSVATTSLSTIFGLPGRKHTNKEYLNHHYRICCRVVNFRPSNIDDFAIRDESNNDQSALGPDFSNYKDPDSMELENDENNDAGWKWNFELDLIGKDGNFLSISVDDVGGATLFKANARDLRQDTQFKAQIREKLFNLWGNLEEVMGWREKKRAKTITQAKQLQQKLLEGTIDDDTIEKYVARLERIHERNSVKKIWQDPRVSNLYFNCIIKEVGITDEDSTSRIFILEKTTIK